MKLHFVDKNEHASLIEQSMLKMDECRITLLNHQISSDSSSWALGTNGTHWAPFRRTWVVTVGHVLPIGTQHILYYYLSLTFVIQGKEFFSHKPISFDIMESNCKIKFIFYFLFCLNSISKL